MSFSRHLDKSEIFLEVIVEGKYEHVIMSFLQMCGIIAFLFFWFFCNVDTSMWGNSLGRLGKIIKGILERQY